MIRDQALYSNYFSVINECEQRFPVAQWRLDDVLVWPMIRIEGRTDLIYAGQAAASSESATRFSALRRAARIPRHAVSPLSARLENLGDWKREILKLRPVDAVFLGDGVSQDFVRDAWRDRYCAPLIEALEAEGQESLLIQSRAQKLPREKPTYSGRWIDAWGALSGRMKRASGVHLPEFAAVEKFLRGNGFAFTLLDRSALERFAMRVKATAGLFEHVLDRTQPKIAFAVSYYWPMGYAFNIACRNRHVLSVDIQHGGQDGCHEAYNHWSALPGQGYPALPNVFWNWLEGDARAVNEWAQAAKPWHTGLTAGHPQLASWLDTDDAQARDFDRKIAEIRQRTGGSHDILVALQDLPGYEAVWKSLADYIASSPASCRWWIRRHPGGHKHGAQELLSLRRSNVLIEESSQLPLPALLRNCGTVVTLMSGMAFEALMFGHRPIFLAKDAHLIWPNLVKSGLAEIADRMTGLDAILKQRALSQTARIQKASMPRLGNTVRDLMHRAAAYRAMSSSRLG